VVLTRMKLEFTAIYLGATVQGGEQLILPKFQRVNTLKSGWIKKKNYSHKLCK